MSPAGPGPGDPSTGETRLGCVVPSVNTVVEQWYPHAVPDGVSVHTARMLIGATVNLESLERMDEQGIAVTEVLATCRPDVVVYACTASTLVRGRAYDLELMQALSEAAGVRCVTATEAVLQATARLGLGSLAVASPYTDELGAREVAFLEANGIEVKGHAHLGISGGFDLAAPEPETILDLVSRAWASAGSADGVFIGCMNLGSHRVITQVESLLGVPVVTSTQASLWHALRLAGVMGEVAGAGRLFAH